MAKGDEKDFYIICSVVDRGVVDRERGKMLSVEVETAIKSNWRELITSGNHVSCSSLFADPKKRLTLRKIANEISDKLKEISDKYHPHLDPKTRPDTILSYDVDVCSRCGYETQDLLMANALCPTCRKLGIRRERRQEVLK